MLFPVVSSLVLWRIAPESPSGLKIAGSEVSWPHCHRNPVKMAPQSSRMSGRERNATIPAPVSAHFDGTSDNAIREIVEFHLPEMS